VLLRTREIGCVRSHTLEEEENCTKVCLFHIFQNTTTKIASHISLFLCRLSLSLLLLLLLLCRLTEDDVFLFLSLRETMTS
jgi:hypothetical protein